MSDKVPHGLVIERASGQLYVEVIELGDPRPGSTVATKGHKWEIGILKDPGPEGYRYRWDEFSPNLAEQILRNAGWETVGEWHTDHGLRAYSALVRPVSAE